MENNISPMVTMVYWGRSHMMWILLSSTTITGSKCWNRSNRYRGGGGDDITGRTDTDLLLSDEDVVAGTHFVAVEERYLPLTVGLITGDGEEVAENKIVQTCRVRGERRHYSWVFSN